MSNERHETVADIVDEMRGAYYKMGRSNASLDKDMMGYMSFMANRIEAAEKREIETLRALVEGLIKASSVDCASCGYDCGPRRENCITKKAIVYLEGHS